MSKGGLIDDDLKQQVTQAAEKWKEILECVTATIQILAQQNLSLSHPNSLHCFTLLKELNNGQSMNFNELKYRSQLTDKSFHFILCSSTSSLSTDYEQLLSNCLQ